MPSLFYEATYSERVVVSFLAIERISALLQECHVEGTQMDEEDFLSAVGVAMKETTGNSLNMRQVTEVAARIQKLLQDNEKAAGRGLGKKRNKGFASGYTQWVEELLPADICLVITNFDYDRALRMYAELDREDVLAMASAKLRMDWEQIKVSYESAVYAFGGSMGEGGAANDENTTIYDLTKADKKGIAAFGKLF